MKKFLFILGLIISCVVFSQMDDINLLGESPVAMNESIMQEKDSADAQRNFEVISNDLKSSNCLTPRRVSQTNSNSVDLRVWKTLKREIQSLLLKSTNQFHKVSQHINTNKSVIISSLFCRMAEHVFTMRKLII